MQNIKRGGLLLALALVLGLSGCATEYAYTPPVTAEGKACVQQCQATQGMCRDQQFQTASSARENCLRTVEHDFRHCQHDAADAYAQCREDARQDYNGCLKYSNDRKACREKPCHQKICHKRTCASHIDYSPCDKDFRACYQQCGGTVGILK